MAAEERGEEDGTVELLCEWADVHGLEGRRVRWCAAVGEEVEAGTVSTVLLLFLFRVAGRYRLLSGLLLPAQLAGLAGLLLVHWNRCWRAARCRV
jgi:hypothetical protein